MLTREQILAMEPGRELDALVAEKVLGWHKVRLMCSGNRTEWEGFPPGVYGSTRVKKISTDIAAVWEVVKKFKEKGWRVHIAYDPDYANVELIRPKTSETYGNGWERVCGSSGKTVEEAICRAALLSTLEV